MEINILKTRITVLEEKGSQQKSQVEDFKENIEKTKALQEQIKELNKQVLLVSHILSY